MNRKIRAVFLAAVLALGLCFVSPGEAKADQIVIVLDPGHGGVHCGCVADGLPYEQHLNLSIAWYCKAELETYEGVTVIMTRTDDVQLSESLVEDLRLRVQTAADNHAAFLVSLHLNASANHTASGSMAFVSFQPNISAQSVAMGNAILNQLAALGLASHGCITTQSPTYFDENGQPKDYYAINRHGADMNIPSIIIESCFMDNPNSVDRAFCATEEGRQRLGIANAAGIAQYFGLQKKGASVEPTPTEPAPTEPAPTEPAPTEPAPTEPAPTEPAPAVPSGTVEVEGNVIKSGGCYAQLQDRTIAVKDGMIFISGIAPGTTAAQFLEGIQTGGTTELALQDAGGTLCTGDVRVGTGISLILSGQGIEYARCPLVIYGDLNTDAELTILDFSIVKAYLLSIYDLTAAQREAADLDHNGQVNILDFSIMKAVLLGTMQVTQ